MPLHLAPWASGLGPQEKPSFAVVLFLKLVVRSLEPALTDWHWVLATML